MMCIFLQSCPVFSCSAGLFSLAGSVLWWSATAAGSNSIRRPHHLLHGSHNAVNQHQGRIHGFTDLFRWGSRCSGFRKWRCSFSTAGSREAAVICLPSSGLHGNDGAARIPGVTPGSSERLQSDHGKPQSQAASGGKRCKSLLYRLYWFVKNFTATQ